jgi:pterin-4a-carbinolamine dehydratase
MTPYEKDKMKLPSTIQRILPAAQANVADIAPIEAVEQNWKISGEPQRFTRTFDLKKRSRVLLFLKEIFRYEMLIKHNGTHTVDGTLVQVKIWTRDLERITSLDIDYAKSVDEIYEDVLHMERQNVIDER